MLDTLKVGIPLTQSQHKRIMQMTAKLDRWQWVMMNQGTGELLFRRVSGLASADQNSYHREFRFDVQQTYSPDCCLTVEFSVPKFWYGHNIHLLYDFTTALKHFKTLLEDQFGMKGRGKLSDPLTWRVLRADCCYAWRFPSQDLCHRFLDSLKRLNFPRKEPVIYKDAIVFRGNTYTVKIYEKLPEFKKHDLRDMVKRKTPLEFVNYCESIADGVLRFEATLRYRYLKRNGIETVADLAKELIQVHWAEGDEPKDERSRYASLLAVSLHHLNQKGVELSNIFQDEWFEKNGHPITDGLTIETPPTTLEFNDEVFDLPAQTVNFSRRHNPIAILQYFLSKFVGANAGMQAVDQVEAKLTEAYKPVKASRLMGFWLYVQRFGSVKAKEAFGTRNYYNAKSDLKKAGVALIEPPSGNNVTVIEKDFLQNFKLEVPSTYATNNVDDFRDSTNVLNFTPRMSGMQYKA